MSDGNAGGFEFAPALAFRPEAAHVRLKRGTVQGLCHFTQLPLAAACLERASHQQDRPRH
jgi:hypothetical protein